MSERLARLAKWMDADEDEHLEFKEAKNRIRDSTIGQFRGNSGAMCADKPQ